MKSFLKNPIVITIGIILTLGILAIIGYNYWGWFGGKHKYPLGANGVPFPKNPKDGDTFTYAGIKYTYSCLSGGGIIAQQCSYAWRTDSEIKLLSMIEREATPQSQNITNNSSVSKASNNILPIAGSIWKFNFVQFLNGTTYQFSGPSPFPKRTIANVKIKFLNYKQQSSNVIFDATINNIQPVPLPQPNPYLIDINLGTHHPNLSGAYGEITFF